MKTVPSGILYEFDLVMTDIQLRVYGRTDKNWSLNLRAAIRIAILPY